MSKLIEILAKQYFWCENLNETIFQLFLNNVRLIQNCRKQKDRSPFISSKQQSCYFENQNGTVLLLTLFFFFIHVKDNALQFTKSFFTKWYDGTVLCQFLLCLIMHNLYVLLGTRNNNGNYTQFAINSNSLLQLAQLFEKHPKCLIVTDLNFCTKNLGLGCFQKCLRNPITYRTFPIVNRNRLQAALAPLFTT